MVVTGHCISICLLFRVKFLLGFSLGFGCSPILQLFVSFFHQRLCSLPGPVLDISERLKEKLKSNIMVDIILKGMVKPIL